MDFKVYGASDDLIEITGDAKEEISATYDGCDYLTFDNGLLLKVEYTNRGVWEIDLLNKPDNVRVDISDSSCHDFNDYSQIANISTESDVHFVTVASDITNLN